MRMNYQVLIFVHFKRLMISKKVLFIHRIIQMTIRIALHVQKQYQHLKPETGELLMIITFEIFCFSSLKIYVLDFDIESVRVMRVTSITQINDWLEINDNGEKLYGTRPPFTLLFDDVIEASLTFKSDSTISKRVYHGFLLYFIGKRISFIDNHEFDLSSSYTHSSFSTNNNNNRVRHCH